MSDSMTEPGNKRAHSNLEELPSPKRAQQAPPTVEAPGSLDVPCAKDIYIVSTDESNPYIKTKHSTMGAYISFQDANWRAMHSQDAEDYEEWTEYYDKLGCAHFLTGDAEGARFAINVERVALWDPGSEQEPEEQISSEDAEDDEEDEGGEEEDDSNEIEEEGDSNDVKEQKNGQEEDMSIEESVRVRYETSEIRSRQRIAAHRGERSRTKCGGNGCGSRLCDSCFSKTDEA